MDRIIDTIEAIAAVFVGLVTADIFISVLLRRFFSVQIPDGQTSMRTVTSHRFGVIPMFPLKGAFVSASGVSRELFRAANTFVGHRHGGLGLATIVSCGGFAATSGSSVATAATFSTVAYPEMRRYGYPKSFSAGVIAAGGTLGARGIRASLLQATRTAAAVFTVLIGALLFGYFLTIRRRRGR